MQALAAHRLQCPHRPAYRPALLITAARMPHAHPACPATPTAQTYTAPQSAGQYRFIMGGGTFVGTGDYLDEEVPGGADKAQMTQAQVRPRQAHGMP